jgi:dienelactone hydrolase
MVESGRRLLAAAVVAAMLGVGFGVAQAPPGGAVAPPIVNAPATLARLIPVYALRKAGPPPQPGGATTSHITTTDPDERASLRAAGWQLDTTVTTNCDGIVGYLFDRQTTWATGSTMEVHRFYHPDLNSYFVSTTENPQAFVTGFGFVDQGILGYGFRLDDTTPETTDAAPLRAFTNAATGEWYYSANAAPPRPGFADAGVAARLRPAGPRSSDPAVPETRPAAAQLCPVSMLNATVGGVVRHFATTSASERGARLAAGWTLEATDGPAARDGVVGYLWDRQVPGTRPVYRFLNDAPGLSSYYYQRIDGDPGPQLAALAGLGFVSEGVIGYSFPSSQPGTVPWTPALNAGGGAYYYATPAGAAYAAAHGYTDVRAPGIHLFTAADPATPYYELRTPAGTSKGVVVWLHGGSWRGELPYGLGPPLAGPIYLKDWPATGDTLDPDLTPQRLVARGWTVYSVDYHSGGARSVSDVTWFLEQLRARVGAGTKVCTAGASAGGHLALLMAARRPGDIACVVSLAGPTDLGALPAGIRADHVVPAFGSDPAVWDANSPARAVAAGVTTKVLLATGVEDGVVPPAQMDLMRAALVAAGAPTPTVMTLAPGHPYIFTCIDNSHPFVHTCVSNADYAAYVAAEGAFIDGVAGP